MKRQLDPGWLASAMRDLPLHIMSRHSRDSGFIQHLGIDIPFPIGWDEGEALLVELSKHFQTWTGRSIEEHIAARPKPGYLND